MKKSFLAIAGLLMILGLPVQVFADGQSYEAEGVYHGISQTGLTGLGNTVSPYTVGTGISATVNGVIQPTTGGTAYIMMPSVTLGIGNNIELAARTALLTAPGVSDTGDTEVYAKYKLRSLGEVMPSMAIAAGVVLPTASNPAAAEVNTIGGKLMVIVGGEAQVSDEVVVGMYANVTANFMDPGEPTQNNYITTSFGLMAPLSEDKKVQGFLEYHTAVDKPGVTILGGGPQPVTRIGLRYAGRFLKMTLGVEDGWSTAVIAGGITFEI